MLDTISLIGTPHNFEFLRKFLERFQDSDFLANKE